MAHHLRAELVVDALEMGDGPLETQTLSGGLVHHSERGVQYTPRSPSASGSKKQVSCPLYGPGGIGAG
jgi:hypothetical protein